MWMKCPFCGRYILGLGENSVSKTDKTPALIQLIFKRSTNGWGGER